MTPFLLAVRSTYQVFRRRTETDSWEWLFFVVLAAWSVRLLVVALVYQGFLNPERDHWEFGYEIGRVARSIALGRGYANPYWAETGPTALLTPGYPCLMAAIFRLFGVYSTASALVFLSLNTFFSAVTIVPVFFIARRSFGLPTARLSAWVWAFFPYAIFFSTNTMWYHSCIAFLLALLFLFALRLQSTDSVPAWAGFGALFGVTALINPVILGVYPFLQGWLCVRLRRRNQRVWTATALSLLTMTVTIAPWALRNLEVLHRPIPAKDGFWLEVCVGNLSDSLHWWDGEQHPAGSALERARFNQMGELAYMAARRSEAVAYIQHHPARYAWRTLRHVAFLWTGFWSLRLRYLRQEPYDPENICLLSGLSVLAFGALYRALRNPKTRSHGFAYLVVLLSFPMPYYLSHVDPGFRHPLDPLLIILACSTVTRWLVPARAVVREKEQDLELALR